MTNEYEYIQLLFMNVFFEKYTEIGLNSNFFFKKKSAIINE